MFGLQYTQIFSLLAIYTAIVLVFIWIENKRMRNSLHTKETEMQRRMYEVSILKELGDRIGYSLNVQKIVDVIIGSLRNLLDYSTVGYLLLGEEGKVIFHCVLEESVNKNFITEVKNGMVAALSALAGHEIKLDEIDENISGTKDGLYKEEEMTILYTIMNQASTAVSKL